MLKMAESKVLNDLFLSYEPSVESDVKNLCNKLRNLDMKIWVNFENPKSTIDQIAKNIRNSKLFVCVLTKKYSESKKFFKEVEYAYDIGTKIVVLYLNDLRIDELQRVGMIVTGLNRVNCFNNPNSWFDDDFNNIKKILELKLRVIFYFVNYLVNFIII